MFEYCRKKCNLRNSQIVRDILLKYHFSVSETKDVRETRQKEC